MGETCTDRIIRSCKKLVSAPISEARRKYASKAQSKPECILCTARGVSMHIGIFFGIPSSLFFCLPSFRETCCEQIYVRSMYTRISSFLTFIYRNRFARDIYPSRIQYSSWSPSLFHSYETTELFVYRCIRKLENRRQHWIYIAYPIF